MAFLPPPIEQQVDVSLRAALPEEGRGFGVLRWQRGGLEVPEPALEFVYRGRIDQAERASELGPLRLLGSQLRGEGHRPSRRFTLYVDLHGQRVRWRGVCPRGSVGDALEERFEVGLRQRLAAP